MVRFSICVVFSMRSAAALSALATAVWVARARSVAATRTLRRASSSSSSARMRCVGVEQFVAHGQRRHHREARIADLAEFAAQPLDPRFQALGELEQPHLLPFLAGHAVLPAVDGDVDVAHAISPASRRHRARRGWCRSRHPAVRRSRDWCARAAASSPASRRVRRRAASGRRRAPGSGSPVRSRRGRHRAAARPRFQRVERRHQPPRRGVDIGERRLGIAGPIGGTIVHDETARTFDRLRRTAKSAVRQAVRREIYVASELSATPPRTYAPHKQLFAPQGRFLALDSGIEVLSSPDFPCRRAHHRCSSPAGGSPPSILISGGFSS